MLTILIICVATKCNDTSNRLTIIDWSAPKYGLSADNTHQALEITCRHTKEHVTVARSLSQ